MKGFIIISLVASFLVLSSCTKEVKHEAFESTLPMIMVIDPHVVVAKCDHIDCARDVQMEDGLLLIYKHIDMNLGFAGFISPEALKPNINPEDVSKDIPEQKNLLIFIGQLYEILNDDPTKAGEHKKCKHHNEEHKDQKHDM